MQIQCWNCSLWIPVVRESQYCSVCCVRFAGGDIYVKDLYEKADKASKWLGAKQGFLDIAFLLFIFSTLPLVAILNHSELSGLLSSSMVLGIFLIFAFLGFLGHAFLTVKLESKAMMKCPDLIKIRNWPEFLRLVRR